MDWGFKVEWFGPPKSLTFNRLKVSTETTIKLNTTYLFRCKFDPLYYLPLRCILSWIPWLSLLHWPYSWLECGFSRRYPCRYTWCRGLSSLLQPTIGCSQIQPHRHQPPLHWLVKISRNAQTTLCRFDDASIGGWRSSFQVPLWNIFKKSEGKSFWDCITDWITSS